MQHALKPASGAARAKVVAAELFDELDVAMDETPSTPDLGFRRERLPPLTRDAESWGGFRDRDACAWHPPSVETTADCRGASLARRPPLWKPHGGLATRGLPAFLAWILSSFRLYYRREHARPTRSGPMASRSQRKATRTYRRRAAARGLVRVEVQTPRKDAALIRALAETLRGGAGKAEALRSTLAKAVMNPEMRTAFDIFGSDLPDDVFADVFDQPRQTGWRRVDL